MAIERPKRRLTTILAADAAGYSRLVEADEEGMLERLRTIRKNLVDPVFAAHRGYIVKAAGDGPLNEFASIVGAVRCAVVMEQGMEGRNVNIDESQRIRFRVGHQRGRRDRRGR